ncbi:MAG: LGFP repeat-containing protein [Mycobacterium sp.]
MGVLSEFERNEMREISKRTVAFTAAITAFALVGSGCHANKSNESTSSGTSSTTVTSSAGTSTTTSAGPSTQIPGANGTLYTVQGPILAKWQTLNDAQRKDLGAPYTNEAKTGDGSGVFQQFDGGVLIYKNGGPVYFVWGKIRDQWNKLDGSQGKLGYPTSDEQILPDGSFKSVFEHGTVTFKTGDADATVTMS